MWQRILAVLAARNREFYRDSAGLTWNLLMPVMMIMAFAFIFSGEPKALFKVGVIAPPAIIDAVPAWTARLRRSLN